MATQYLNSSAGATAPHLGLLGSAYLENFGTGPNSNYVALRVATRFQVDQDGDLELPTVSFSGSTDVANQSHQASVGDPNYPMTDPLAFQNLSFRIKHWGHQTNLDLRSPNNRMILRLQGQAGLDQKGASAVTAACLQALDYRLLTLLTAGTSPFTANADVDCNSTNWAQATTAIDTQILTAIANCQATGFVPDSVLLDHTAARHFRHSVEHVLRYGGNNGAGGLGQENYLGAWAKYGIVNVYECLASSALGDKVILFKRGSEMAVPGDMGTSGAIIMPWQLPEGADPDNFGMAYFDGLVGLAGRVHQYGCFIDADFVINPQLGVRLTNVY